MRATRELVETHNIGKTIRADIHVAFKIPLTTDIHVAFKIPQTTAAVPSIDRFLGPRGIFDNRMAVEDVGKPLDGLCAR